MELLKKHIITIVLIAVTAIGGTVWTLIQKGSEATFNEKVDARIKLSMSNSHLIDMLLKTDKIKEFTERAGRQIEDRIIEDVIKKDSVKISTRAFIGSSIGIRDEQVLPLMAKLLKDYKDGKITTTNNLDSLIRRRLRIPEF